MPKNMVTIDGNEAASNVAYAFSEVAAIYPITPSSTMGEMADAWAAGGKKNIFGQTLQVMEMQSEAGAAGAVHGSLSAGALTTTFTASQGLLLMVPNMFKIAGEMLPTVFHVSARSIAAQSLSIFGDHSDVMATRQTGFGLISSASVQEAQDIAAIAHLASLESKLPFVHFFDGFRTSSEVQKIEQIDYETLASMLDMKYVEEFRAGAMSPDKPIVKVGAQNPDVYFQGRETVNRFYDEGPAIVEKYMKLFAEKTGREYKLFEYVGDPKAEKVIIAMGSGVETIEETVGYLNRQGEKVGAIKVRLYRPWSAEHLQAIMPETVKKIAVLDRTKEPGAPGEPLFLDVSAAFQNKGLTIIGGRFGLSSKEFTPAMVKAVYDHLDGACFHDFTVGINDDVTKKSIAVKEVIDTEQEGITRCKFWGYGSDGTVSANKNSIKIIGNDTDLYAQGYFQYDSNKSGGWTVSHLRFGKKPIHSEYLLTKSDFIALHRHQYIGQFDILEGITEGGTFLINIGMDPEKVFAKFTEDMQSTIREKKVKVFTIDASSIAKDVGLGGRINTVMQTAFFKLSGVLPEDEAIALIKKAVEKQFKKKGQEIVEMNWRAIDAAVDAIKEVPIPSEDVGAAKVSPVIPEDADTWAQEVIDPVLRLKGDSVPVSKMPINGAVPIGTKRLEKRGKRGSIPVKWIAKSDLIKDLDVQLETPYFEYPGSCQGCGEVGYVYMVTQLFGDRMIIANATGCSSIYGGTFPTTPYAADENGRGPTWANSLFEDNAEYGFGMRLAVDSNRAQLRMNAEMLLEEGTEPTLAKALRWSLENWSSVTAEAKANAQAIRTELPAAHKAAKGNAKKIVSKLIELQDYFIDKSVWCFGGDGWAYDIGYGGLDHIMAQDKNINVLVMDTEVYSNTGGQASKATPRGAIAKFAASGKQLGKKNLGLMMTTYGNTFVASVNMSANREQVLEAIVQAERYNGPSIVIAYSPCIAHGYDLKLAGPQSKAAASSGYWPIYRYNPDLRALGENPFVWESEEVTTDFKEYTQAEIRYRALELSKPEEALRLRELAIEDNKRRFDDLRKLTNEE
jgi:pyruvate/2-oxoacid:ferredoxin oxidoreductase alpha subunit/pyruvate/2-oxoacid:ferredoxin oxidoreductase beta subunit/Pyruvate/2-oxoacid:ferredoxin oxidoreductase gamma subunit